MKIKNYAMNANLGIIYRVINVLRMLLIIVLFQGINIIVECVKKNILMKMESA